MGQVCLSTEYSSLYVLKTKRAGNVDVIDIIALIG